MRTTLTLVVLCILAAAPAVSGVEDDFDYFVNNWNVIGLPDYMYGARITPDSEMQLPGGASAGSYGPRVDAGRSEAR